MNTSFVTELFQSKEFVADYHEFLSKVPLIYIANRRIETFYNIMVSDNNRKVEKFVQFLENCYLNQSFAVKHFT